MYFFRFYLIDIFFPGYDGILNHYDFDIGWSWVGKEQDISNFEWRFWYGMFWQVWPWYLGHAALGKIMEWNYPAVSLYENVQSYLKIRSKPTTIMHI